jgi:hypothetical protein
MIYLLQSTSTSAQCATAHDSKRRPISKISVIDHAQESKQVDIKAKQGWQSTKMAPLGYVEITYDYSWINNVI